MLSDEEKKTIKEIIKVSKERYIDDVDYGVMFLIDLIEKQQKEIELNKHWEDKIKAEIEEYKKQVEKMEKDDIGIRFTLGKKWCDLKAKIEFGQSLLEEKE